MILSNRMPIDTSINGFTSSCMLDETIQHERNAPLSFFARFLLNLKEINVYIAIQAVLDALDIWLSAIKYVFDAMNPLSGNQSTRALFRFLATEVGLLTLALGSAFWGLFAFVANYNDAKRHQKPTLMQQASACAEDVWPYVRDCFKGLKWTFKGTRSLILILQMLFKTELKSLISPLGMILGIFSVFNRGWIRNMVEARKTTQSQNDLFREHIRYINAGFIEVDEKWEQEFITLDEKIKNIYLGSVIQVKRINKTDEADNQTTYDHYYVKKNQIAAAQGLVTESYQLVKLYTEIAEDEFRCLLDKGSLEPGMSYNVSSSRGVVLWHVVQDPMTRSLTPYQDDTLPPAYRAQFISQAELRFIERLDVNHVTRKFDFYHYKKNLTRAGVGLVSSRLGGLLQTKYSFLTKLSDAPDHTLFDELYSFPQSQAKKRRAYAAAFISGLMNAPYYFLGVLSTFLDVIPLATFPFAVATCTFFMGLNIVAELYQEFDYQRRLSISRHKAKLSMLKRLVSYEWDNINHLIDEALQSPLNDDASICGAVSYLDKRPAHEQVFMQVLAHLSAEGASPYALFWRQKLAHNTEEPVLDQDNGLQYVFSQRARTQLLTSLERLHQYDSDFVRHKEALKHDLKLGTGFVFMQGIKNGLHLHGVYNGCIIALSTMAFLWGWTLSLSVLYASFAVGAFLLVGATIFTLLQSNKTQDHELEIATGELEGEPQAPERADLSLQIQTDANLWIPDPVIQSVLDERDIQPSKNLMISEQCEVVRQFMSGSKKGVKNLQTLLILMLGAGAQNPTEVQKLLYVGIGLACGGMFSLKGLRGLVRVDNEEYKSSLLLGSFFKSAPAEDRQAPRAGMTKSFSWQPLNFNSALLDVPEDLSPRRVPH